MRTLRIAFTLCLLWLIPAEARSPRHRNGITSDTAAFHEDSGARDLAGVNKIIRFASWEDVLEQFVLYPMKSAQNAGTGTTVYAIGRLAGNDMTLVNGPTWGAGGLAFASASSQYGTIADFLGSETLTVFHRASEASTPDGDATLISQFDTGSNQRSWWLRHQGQTSDDPYSLLRYADGTISSFESYILGGASSTAERCYVVQWVDGGGRKLWFNKTEQTLSLVGGSAQTSRFNSTADILINAVKVTGSPTLFNDQTAHATAFLTGSVTTTQRETITDLINAL